MVRFAGLSLLLRDSIFFQNLCYFKFLFFNIDTYKIEIYMEFCKTWKEADIILNNLLPDLNNRMPKISKQQNVSIIEGARLYFLYISSL